MNKDKFLDIYNSAAIAMLDVNKKIIIEPFESEVESICKKILQNFSFVDDDFLPKGKNVIFKGGTFGIFEAGEINYDIFYGMLPLHIKNFLREISSITYIMENNGKVGEYYPGGGDAYVIRWEVWIIDLKTQYSNCRYHI